MKQVKKNGKEGMRIACEGDSTVLIQGATGTGKTTLARKIHDRSSRAKRPFITVNLATLHEGTFEAELFGHERGAFTGADQRRIGRLEAAQGGTVFLDEIGELTPRQQARLLEFLQSRTVSPLGSHREAVLDVRIIAATHRDLRKAVAAGTFRADLFHRLRMIELRLPSISERAHEFGVIVHESLEEVCLRQGKSVHRISEMVACRLEAHTWPGNYRELRNVLEFAVQACDGEEIRCEDLPDWFLEELGPNPQALAAAWSEGGVIHVRQRNDFDSASDDFEREFLHWALLANGRNITATARAIRMSKTSLLRRMGRLGLYKHFPSRKENGLDVNAGTPPSDMREQHTHWMRAAELEDPHDHP